MRRATLALALVGCGRSNFDPHAARDGAVDGSLAHVMVAPGWTATVLADLTGVVPYRPTDFMNGTTEVLDNAPDAVAALYAPFTATFAIAAGRSLIELAADGTTTVHDYRPAIPDTTGPDAIYRLTFGDVPDVGPNVWLGSPSQGAGDGLYRVSPTWALTRDNMLNNVTGIGFDPTGGFDGIGVPTIYFANGNNGISRRDPGGTSTTVFAALDSLDDLAVTATALFTNHDPTTQTTADIYRIFATTHASQTVVTATTFAIAEGGELAATDVVAIRAGATLAIYANDGTHVDGASSTDPAWVWIEASRPRVPHPLAGKIIVLESNRTLDQDRLLVVTPP